MLLWGLPILALLAAYLVYEDVIASETDDNKKTVPQMLALLSAPESASAIDRVVVQPLGDGTARYTLHSSGSRKAVAVVGPYDGAGNEISAALATNDVKWTVEPMDEDPFWQRFVVSWLPMLLIAGLVLYVMRRGRGGNGGIANFGKSTAKLLTKEQSKVTFRDVAGIQEAREEVEEIIAFLENPKKFTRLGGRIPKGILLMGSPGTGKTLLARAIAGEANVPFFSMSGSDFVEMFVGVGASRVRDLFAQGKKNAPCILFIDEIDAVGRRRGAGLGGGNDEREQTLNQLLVEMDGFESNAGVILIAATNRPDVLDPALLRPGRFDRRIHVSRPDINGRLGILQIHTKTMPLDGGVNLSTIAKGTPGFSGADLGNLTNEGALLAARRDKDVVEMVDFEDAKDKVLMGAARVSMYISDNEKRNTAMHEAGHAMVALLIGGDEVDPLHKVTIIPRGDSLGLTQQLPTEDRLSMTREFALNRICILMGGRCAEELVFQQRTTGAESDIKTSTTLARRMVTEWGMSERLGPVKFSRGDSGVFLAMDRTGKAGHCSEKTSESIDSEVGRIVSEQYARATELLRDRLATLIEVGEKLLSVETLSGTDVEALVALHGNAS